MRQIVCLIAQKRILRRVRRNFVLFYQICSAGLQAAGRVLLRRLIQERSVCIAPDAVVADKTVGAGGTVQACAVSGFAIGKNLISRIELCQLMILIPVWLRPQCKIAAIAVADGHEETGT